MLCFGNLILKKIKFEAFLLLRDLTGEDIPLLENVRDKGLAAIREKYGIRQDQVGRASICRKTLKLT